MADPKALMRNILSDMKVELADMFDKNFVEKGFFGQRWKPRKVKGGKGTLLVVTANMRRSVRAAIKGKGVVFTSAMPYTALHNEGGKFKQSVKAYTATKKKTGTTYAVKAHTRNVNMPRRQFVGDHAKVQRAIKKICEDNKKDYFNQLAKQLKK